MTWEIRIDISVEKGMVGLIQDPRADSSGAAVGVGGQGVGVCQGCSCQFKDYGSL